MSESPRGVTMTYIYGKDCPLEIVTNPPVPGESMLQTRVAEMIFDRHMRVISSVFFRGRRRYWERRANRRTRR